MSDLPPWISSKPKSFSLLARARSRRAQHRDPRHRVSAFNYLLIGSHRSFSPRHAIGYPPTDSLVLNILPFFHPALNWTRRDDRASKHFDVRAMTRSLASPHPHRVFSSAESAPSPERRTVVRRDDWPWAAERWYTVHTCVLGHASLLGHPRPPEMLFIAAAADRL